MSERPNADLIETLSNLNLEQRLILKELVYSGSSYPVFEAALTLKGEQAGPKVLESLTATGSQFKGCVVFGEPGAGKTTFLAEFRKKILNGFVEEETGYWASPLEFDGVVQLVERESGLPRNRWGSDLVTQFSDVLCQVVQNNLDNNGDRGSKHLWLVEMVGVGSGDGYGKPALRDLAQRKDLLFLAIVGHPVIKQRAISLRAAIHDLIFRAPWPTLETIEQILLQHEILVQGPYLFKVKKLREIARVIINSADPAIIKRVESQLLTEARSLERLGLIDRSNIVLPEEIENNLKRFLKLRLKTSEAQAKEFTADYHLKVAYLQRYLQEIGVPEEQQTVLLTPFVDRPMIWSHISQPKLTP